MPSLDVRPKWWQLNLIFPLFIALFAVDHWLKISIRGHQVVQFGIILLVYSLTLFWLRTNKTALSKMDQRKVPGRITVIRILSSQLPDAGEAERPMFQLPDSEIKGTLSDTFEMDYIDAEYFPVDETAEDLKKE